MNILDLEIELALESLVSDTDSYKFSHWKQTPPEMENAFAYIASRGTDLPWDNPRIMLVGPQMFMLEYMTKPITRAQVDAVGKLAEMHGFGGHFNYDGWYHICDKHNGILPITIRAPKEGTVMGLGNAMVTFEPTDRKAYWLGPYIETMWHRAVWYPSSVATNSFRAKEIIKKYLEKTSDDPENEILFKLHDFGARGASSNESARIGGAAHLINFLGTDTFQGALHAMKNYRTKNMPGFSINAAEHFTITAWGMSRERDAYLNMLKKFGGEGTLVAVVSDSYNIYHAVSQIWGEELKDEVKKLADEKRTLVIRPDSGDPVVVPIEIIEILFEKFGYTINKKGYKVLPDYVRVIQGDGITVDTIDQILKCMEARKISASNIAFGMGAGLLQKVDRDTYKFSMKCSSREENGIWIDTFKDPITDKGKKSLKGRVTLVQNVDTKQFRTARVDEPLAPNEVDAMRVIYNNGIVEEALMTFEEVRVEANKYLT